MHSRNISTALMLLMTSCNEPDTTAVPDIAANSQMLEPAASEPSSSISPTAKTQTLNSNINSEPPAQTVSSNGPSQPTNSSDELGSLITLRPSQYVTDMLALVASIPSLCSQYICQKTLGLSTAGNSSETCPLPSDEARNSECGSLNCPLEEIIQATYVSSTVDWTSQRSIAANTIYAVDGSNLEPVRSMSVPAAESNGNVSIRWQVSEKKGSPSINVHCKVRSRGSNGVVTSISELCTGESTLTLQELNRTQMTFELLVSDRRPKNSNTAAVEDFIVRRSINVTQNLRPCASVLPKNFSCSSGGGSLSLAQKFPISASGFPYLGFSACSARDIYPGDRLTVGNETFVVDAVILAYKSDIRPVDALGWQTSCATFDMVRVTRMPSVPFYPTGTAVTLN